MPRRNFKTALTVRQTENEIFTDRILSFGKAVSESLTRSQEETFLAVLYNLKTRDTIAS